MDTIFLQGLKIEATIGVFAWEKHIKQQLVLDLEVQTDTKRAAQSDQLDDALDYKAMAQSLKTYAESKPFGLLETLAEQLAAQVLDEFNQAQAVKLTIHKPYAVRHAKDVGIIIERRRQE